MILRILVNVMSTLIFLEHPHILMCMTLPVNSRKYDVMILLTYIKKQNMILLSIKADNLGDSQFLKLLKLAQLNPRTGQNLLVYINLFWFEVTQTE